MEKNSKAILKRSEVDSDLANKFEKARATRQDIHAFMNEFMGQFISPQTKRAYLLDLQNFFDFVKKAGINIEHPKDIQAHFFQIYRDELQVAGLASATINRKLVSIRSFIKWALACRLIDVNPLDAVKLPKVQTKHHTQAFSDSEVTDMLSAPDCQTAAGQMHRLAMILLFGLGLRRSELVSIKLLDFYRDRSHLVLKIEGKGGKHRELPISESIEKEIEQYYWHMTNTFHFDLSEQKYLLFTPESYQKSISVNGSTIFRIIQRYAKKLGINKQVGAHSCRATAISHLLDTQSIPIRDVAIFAGHSNITTTERYDKRRDNLDRSAAYKINYSKKSA